MNRPWHVTFSKILTHWSRDKMAAFSRRHFQIHFVEWKCSNCDKNFTEVCSQGSNWQYSSIGSDNGLVPSRRQSHYLNQWKLVYWRIYASLGLNELNMTKSYHCTSCPNPLCRLAGNYTWYICIANIYYVMWVQIGDQSPCTNMWFAAIYYVIATAEIIAYLDNSYRSIDNPLIPHILIKP